MSDIGHDAARLTRHGIPGSPYSRTLLGRVDMRLFQHPRAPLILGVVFTLLLVIPSIQFLDKIHETKFSPYRDRDSQRTAVGRWLPDAIMLQQGGDPYGELHWFPSPPIVLISLVPFARMPLTLAAVIWAVLKIAAVVGGCLLALTAVSRKGLDVPRGVLIMAALFSARPIIGDITHGNINIFVFFEIAVVWYLFVQRYDWMAGVVLGLAVCTKVTPGLLIVYFLYKRAWRVVGGAGVGLLLFAVVVPSLIVGFSRNLELLSGWYHMMVVPYLHHGFVTIALPNQSLPGVLMRVLGHLKLLSIEGLTVEQAKQFGVIVGEMAKPATLAGKMLIRGANLSVIVALALLCRRSIRDRRDLGLLLEFSLVLLAMLLLSERTWKHHLTTLPLVYLATWLALTCRTWSPRFVNWFVAGLGLQLLLLLLLKSDVALYAGAITLGLLLCFVQNAILLRRLPDATETLPVPPAAAPATSA